MIKLATVSPCYNEEAVLRHSVERLTALFERMITDGLITADSMMVFVNDGSRDNTWQIIKELHANNKYVRGINLSRNVGHQNAIMAGMLTARQWADAVITIDADLQDDIECIPQMVKKCEAGSDIVYGVKVSRQADSLTKRWSAQAFYKLQSSMGVESVYNHADFRLMSRRALDMLAEYKEHNLYLRGLIPQIGLQCDTVDDTISERFAGNSKYTISKMLSLAMNGVTSFSARPLYAIVHMGIIFIVIALCIAIYVIHALITGTAAPGWSSLILSIWLVGGFVLVSIGIVGIYIGKIFTEVKHRPLYHIAEIIE
jgi:glycosyltransferase involved in cell wall biosynthesis